MCRYHEVLLEISKYANTDIDVVPTSHAETETSGPDHTVCIDLVAGIPTQLQLTTPIYL